MGMGPAAVDSTARRLLLQVKPAAKKEYGRMPIHIVEGSKFYEGEPSTSQVRTFTLCRVFCLC